MGDGRALRRALVTTRAEFAKAFDIPVQARDKSVQNVWGQSWGMTTPADRRRDNAWPRRRQRTLVLCRRA